MALQKGVPGARKVRGGHYLVFQSKAIFKKKVIVIAEPFLVYENKVISKKSLRFIWRATFECLKTKLFLKKGL